jgi:hypothetical protein
MSSTLSKLLVPVFILAIGLGASFSATPKKKAPPIIEFTGTVIDNKTLKQHADSLQVYLPKLDKMDVHNNVKSGYSLVSTDGKVYKLDFESVEALWNAIKTPRGGSPLHSLKIHGMGLKLGNDSLKITGYEDAK